MIGENKIKRNYIDSVTGRFTNRITLHPYKTSIRS